MFHLLQLEYYFIDNIYDEIIISVAINYESEAPFKRRKELATYGGMDASDIRKLKEFENENRRLKQMYANLSLEHKALKDVVAKSSKASPEKRAGRLHERGVSITRAVCRALDLRRTVYPSQPSTEKDLPVFEALLRLAGRETGLWFWSNG